ncbi:pantetheinase-like [Oratosquilla oratoria]|uniref:pantetheinase-like n=1 Tax=Oratosquilla oratoria TaxID=337810 RepID=UPI003F76F8DF
MKNSRKRIVLIFATVLLFGSAISEEDISEESIQPGSLGYTKTGSNESEKGFEDDRKDEVSVVSSEEEGIPRKTPVTYTAAVVEYEPYSNWELGGLHIILENAKIFEEFTIEAKFKDADLIVFPEGGLTTLDFRNTQVDIDSLSQIVPDPQDLIAPCFHEDTSDYQKALKVLSCAAATLEIYMAVNLVEKIPASIDIPPSGAPPSDTRPTTVIDEGSGVIDEEDNGQKAKTNESYYHNTNVVFDRLGRVIARYRKKHLYLSPHLHPGLDPDESALFHTDFGVTFSLQICFDIMYADPAVSNVVKHGVHDVILSTAWIDELPFLTAPQIGLAWSLGLGVNLLAANYRHPATGALGSGLYRSFLPEQPLYYYNHAGGSKMLLGKVVSVVDEKRGTDQDVDKVVDLGNEDRLTPKPVEVSGNKDIKGNYKNKLHSNVYYSTNDVVGTSSGITGFSIVDITERVTENGVHPLEVTDMPDDAFFYHQDLSNFSHVVLSKGHNGVVLNQSVCHVDNLCCSVEYSYDDLTSSSDTARQSEYTYMLIAYSGIDVKGQGVYDMYSQFCGIVYCMNESISTCTMIEQMAIDKDTTFRPEKLEGYFATKFVYPSIMLQDLTLYDLNRWTYESYEPTPNEEGIVKYSSVRLNGDVVSPVLSIGLFGRWFERDP